MEKSNKKINMSIIFLYIISALLIVAIFVVSISFIHYMSESKNNNNVLYGVVVEQGENYLIINPTDGSESVMISTNEKYGTGSLLRVLTKSKKSPYTASAIEVVVSTDEMKNAGNTIPTSFVTTEASTSEKITTIDTTTETTTEVKTTEVQTTTEQALDVDDDSVILNSIKKSYEDIKNNIDKEEIKAKSKEYFITLVDFIFYDGTIGDVKFIDLKASTKAKVIYYTLLIDSKIDEKIPGYKEKLEEKYADIKAKLVAKYLDFITTVCEDNKENCDLVKKDFNELKNVLNITWDFLKSVFKYCYDHSVPKIVEWYEVFSGKR